MYVLIAGPAGSGKSLLTGEFGGYLESNYSVRYMNLDSGVVRVPYQPDFDVRDHYTLEEIMSEEDLGPNGATLEAIDRLSRVGFPEFADDFVLVDTPGQLEPLVFRSGADIIRKFSDLCIFLFDGTAPMRTFPSQYLYSLAAQYSLDVPMVRSLNKIDLIEDGRVEELERMMMDPRMFREVSGTGMRSQMNMDIADMLLEMYRPSQFPTISAETREGFENLLTFLLESVRTEQEIGSDFPSWEE